MEIKTIDQYIFSMMHDPALLEDEADLLNGCKNTEEYIIKKILACEDTCDRYAEKIADLENKNRGLQNELTNAEQHIKELEDKIRTKTKVRGTTAPASDSNDLRDPSEDMTDKNANLEKDNRRLEKLLDFAKIRIADLERENMILQKKCEELRATVKQCGQEIVRTKKEADEATAEMKNKLDYCSRIQDKYYATLEEQRSPLPDDNATEDDDEDDCDYNAYDNYM